ncbi:MAG: hypothetical protein AAF236_04235 [Verrucomicrobiota bacterium]
MKKIFLLVPLIAIFALTSPTEVRAQQSLNDVYQEGVALFEAGKYAEALVRFDLVLQKKPGFVYARSYAGKARAAIAKGATKKNDLEGQLASIQVPEISFDKAPIGDVLDYLSQRAVELSGGKIAANFIYKGTPQQRDTTLVTLSLRNVPLTEAIRYVGQLTRTNIRYEPHAVVADPNYEAPQIQSASPQPVTPEANQSPTPQNIFD